MKIRYSSHYSGEMSFKQYAATIESFVNLIYQKSKDESIENSGESSEAESVRESSLERFPERDDVKSRSHTAIANRRDKMTHEPKS